MALNGMGLKTDMGNDRGFLAAWNSNNLGRLEETKGREMGML
jgi:hypothetical protein